MNAILLLLNCAAHHAGQSEANPGAGREEFFVCGMLM